MAESALAMKLLKRKVFLFNSVFTNDIILYFVFNEIYLQAKYHNLFPCGYVMFFTNINRVEETLDII